MIWLVIAICYLGGLKAFLGMSESRAAAVFISSHYPDKEQASEILSKEQEGEEQADLCFYWDGGIQSAYQEEYGKKTEVLAAGLLGDASLYDFRAGGFSKEDRAGCVIDRETALELFGSTQAEGGQLTLLGKAYQVRKVVSWKQRIILIRPEKKETAFTRVFVRPKSGESAESAAEQFLMRWGLTGTTVKDGGLRVGALAALILLPAVIAAGLFCSAWRERKRCGGQPGQYWAWTGACAAMAVFFAFLVWRYVRIPVDWIPGKWSDFQFWPEKIKEEYENLKLYLMMPKTVSQTEQILEGAKAAGGAFAALVLYLLTRKKSQRPVC